MSEIAEDCNGRPLISRGFWFRLVAAALAVRVFVVFVLLHSEPLVSDARAYTRQARELVHHFPGGAYYWPPGQSYLLASVFAVVGDSDAVAKATNIAVDVANVVLAVLLARRLLTDARAIRLTGWLLALFPSTVLLAGEPYSLSLTMFCLLGAALLLLRGDERNRWLEFAGAGALIGFGVLTRPSVVTVVAALVVVMGVLVWRRSRRSPARVRPLVARSAAFVAVSALVVVPVLHHNADHGQGWTVSTANEQNFWFGNNPYTPTYKTWELGQRAPTDPKAVSTSSASGTTDRAPRVGRNGVRCFTRRLDSSSIILRSRLFEPLTGHRRSGGSTTRAQMTYVTRSALRVQNTSRW